MLIDLFFSRFDWQSSFFPFESLALHNSLAGCFSVFSFILFIFLILIYQICFLIQFVSFLLVYMGKQSCENSCESGKEWEKMGATERGREKECVYFILIKYVRFCVVASEPSFHMNPWFDMFCKFLFCFYFAISLLFVVSFILRIFVHKQIDLFLLFFCCCCCWKLQLNGIYNNYARDEEHSAPREKCVHILKSVKQHKMIKSVA